MSDKSKIEIIKVERLSSDSPLPIYNISINLNCYISHQEIIVGNQTTKEKFKTIVDINFFEISDNILLPMNEHFLAENYIDMPYNLGAKPYQIYRKFNIREYE